jgi:hypothetical protein
MNHVAAEQYRDQSMKLCWNLHAKSDRAFANHRMPDSERYLAAADRAFACFLYWDQLARKLQHIEIGDLR